VISVDEQIPFWFRGPQYTPQLRNLNHDGGPLRSFGRKSGATIGTNISYGRGFAMDGSLIPAQLATPTQFHISLQTQRAAKKVGEIHLSGIFAAQNLPDTPFGVVVRPAWYTRTAKQLHVTGVKWHPAQKGSGGTVAVGLIYSGKKPLIMRGATASGWKPRYMNLNASYSQSAASKDEIVAHWSQHIESSDRKYNSLNELEYAETDLFLTAKIGQNIDSKALADSFEPRVLPQNYKISGNRIRVVFNVTSLPKAIKNPVFKAEMGVTGDGFIEVSCPLKP